MRKVEVFIEGQRLDLFKEESINLNRSVQDIKDISKIYTDFTQTFTVPASKNNQKIFRHFEIPEIDNGFDTRVKKNGSITLNTLDFVSGKIRLEKVQLKENKPSSFSITFFGDLVSLKDLLGEDKLRDLDWLSQFDHPYTSANIYTGLTDSLEWTLNGINKQVIRYPLLSSVRRIIYDTVTPTDTESIVNIVDPGIIFTELKPSIGFEFIIQAIEEKYGVKFSGDFFKRQEFRTLQLWLSNDKGYMKAGGDTSLVFDDGKFTSNNLFVGTVERSWSNSLPPDYYSFTLTITPSTNAPFNVVIKDLGEPFQQQTDITGETIISGEVNEQQPEKTRDFEIGFFLSSNSSMSFSVNLKLRKHTFTNAIGYTTETRNIDLNITINGTVKILEQMPDLKIFDFLSGLFKMFNLTIVPNNDTLEINNLEEWYREGKIIDITSYVDNTDLPIEKGTVLGQIDLVFEEPKTFLQSEFVNNYDRSYGDLNLILRDDTGKKLDGERLEIKLPFEQIIYERLTDIATGNLSNTQYAYVVDEDESPVKVKPHLFYNVRRTEVNGKLINDAGVAQTLFNVNTPSHIGSLDLTQFSTTFSADYEEFTGNAITSNLLTNYYLDYLTDLFSPKRRVFNYRAKLPTHLLRSIKLNDRLIIKGRRYLINTMDLDLTSNRNSNADLELINDIYRGETQESLTTKMLLSSYYGEYEKGISIGSFTYQTNEEVNNVVLITVEDIGNGNDWVTFTHTDNLIEYSLPENTTGEDRYTALKLTGFSGSVTYYKIKQNA